MMKIILTRHGQTTGDIECRYGGDYDDHLTKLGEDQAKDLASKIANFGIEKIFYSPRIRAKETAEILSDELKIPTDMVENLRERNAYGILTGMTKEMAKEKYPALIDKLKDPRATIEGAEEYELFKKRVIETFQYLASQKMTTIGVVTHGGVISCFLREVIGRERKRLDDCGLIELSSGENYKIISLHGVELD